jgi:hypothetical protein
MAIDGERVKFSFYFYPESVESGGTKNKARAGIYYEYAGGSETVFGLFVGPTSLKWYNAGVTVTLPTSLRKVAVIIEGTSDGTPEFKAWIDLAQLTTPDYNLYYAYPPYDNQGTYPQNGTCITWYNLAGVAIAKVCVSADKSTGLASAYSWDASGIGTGKEAYAQFNRDPIPGNSPQVYEEDGFSVGAYWVAYGHLGSGGPGVPCGSHAAIIVYLYWFNPLEGRYTLEKQYRWIISSYDYPIQDVYYSGSVSEWISSPPRGSGTYTVAARARTYAIGSADCGAEADFLFGAYFMRIEYIKMSD